MRLYDDQKTVNANLQMENAALVKRNKFLESLIKQADQSSKMAIECSEKATGNICQDDCESAGVTGESAGVMGEKGGVMSEGAGVMGESAGVMGESAGVMGEKGGVMGESAGVMGESAVVMGESGGRESGLKV
ncbi:hypothetical protein Btru_067973 [Bulinus truncatus]|nr:hypothetical protein Btru_067973 [Bulinus truncatus]